MEASITPRESDLPVPSCARQAIAVALIATVVVSYLNTKRSQCDRSPATEGWIAGGTSGSTRGLRVRRSLSSTWPIQDGEIYSDRASVDIGGTYRLVIARIFAIDSVHVYVPPELTVRSLSFEEEASRC